MAAPKLTPEEKLARRRAQKNASVRKWRNANLEVARARDREAYKNPERREVLKARVRKYYEANREAIHEREREARKRRRAEADEAKLRKLREDGKAATKKYRDANREAVRERERTKNFATDKLEKRREQKKAASKKWYDANRGAILAWWKEEYRPKNRDKRDAWGRNRRARLRDAPGRHTAADVAALFERQRAKCAACKVPVTKTGKAKYHVDHIQPLARGGSNDPANLQLLCKTCNLSKHARDPHEWAREKGLLFL